jgi:L-threonylcarbamoyladenylate synthase
MAVSTAVWKVDPADPDPGVVRRAAAVLRGGGLVAFPTETVYGLGANARNEWAVRKVFAAKGRPATNPLIVHVADAGQVGEVAAVWPDAAAKLAAAFWPGPLTLVVPKKPGLSDVVTGGGPTVAVRCPRHPVAQALIRAAGVPVAAPSANRSTELSPTRAEHVSKGLAGRIDAVLDGGPCPGGIESTVVDVTGDVVRVLRPGLVTGPMLEAVVGRIEASGGRQPPVDSGKKQGADAPRSPGQMAKHYSPRTPVVLAEGAGVFDVIREATAAGDRLGVLYLRNIRGVMDSPTDYAAAMYARLHFLDAKSLDVILIEMPPDTPEWAAVRDRLMRAAGPG